MIKKAKDLAIHEKDTGSSEVQIALLTEKIESELEIKPKSVETCLKEIRKQLSI